MIVGSARIFFIVNLKTLVHRRNHFFSNRDIFMKSLVLILDSEIMSWGNFELWATGKLINTDKTDFDNLGIDQVLFHLFRAKVTLAKPFILIKQRKRAGTEIQFGVHS